MNIFNEINISQFQCNPFKMIGDDWMLITAEKDGKVNTMTAAWGGIGFLWKENVVYIFIRESRYTKEFVDASDTFSLTFFDTEKYRDMLTYAGTVSGRDEDKIKKYNLTVLRDGSTPYFAEAEKVIICKKLSKHFISPEGMVNPDICPKFYADNDYHYMYVGKIEKILEAVV